MLGSRPPQNLPYGGVQLDPLSSDSAEPMHPSPYLRDCALTLPLAVGLGATIGGQGLAAAVGLVGLVVLVQLHALDRLVRSLTRAVVDGAAPAGASWAFTARLGGVGFVALALCAAVGPLAVALGWSCVLLGAVLHALVQVIPDAESAYLAPAGEPRC